MLGQQVVQGGVCGSRDVIRVWGEKMPVHFIASRRFYGVLCQHDHIQGIAVVLLWCTFLRGFGVSEPGPVFPPAEFPRKLGVHAWHVSCAAVPQSVVGVRVKHETSTIFFA